MAKIRKKTASKQAFVKILFLFGILISGCHNSSNINEKINSLNTAAQGNYFASVHAISLPFKDSCFDTIAMQTTKLPDSLKSFANYGHLVGKVYETKHYVALLYVISADIQLPVLHTFTMAGKEISSLKLFMGSCCGENENCSGVSTAEITKDLHIVLKDSTQTFVRNKKKSAKKRNIELSKKYLEFKIDSVGTIIPLAFVNYPFLLNLS